MILQIMLFSKYTHHTSLVSMIYAIMSLQLTPPTERFITSQDIGAPHYAYVDVSSGNSSVQMIYYTRHTNMVARHCVSVDVSLSPPSF